MSKEKKTEILHAKSLEDAIKQCKVDTKIWNVEDYSVKELSSGEFLYTIYFKRTKEKIDWDNFKKDLKLLATRPNQISYPKHSNPLLMEFSFPDFHFSKLAWAEETGNNYDMKIARNLLRKATGFVINQAKNFNIGKILVPLGNDFFQTDNNENTTTAGTPQSVDSRHHKMFREGYKIVIEIVNKLREIAPVDIIACPGNHDQACALYLTELLDCYYSQDDDVNVDTRAIMRKYYRWGANLIGFTHGDKIKINDLAVIMATERKRDWAETKYRFWRLGHFHTNKMVIDEKCGVIAEVLPSLSGTDDWHFEKGYVNNIRGIVSSIYDKEAGLIAKLNYNL